MKIGIVTVYYTENCGSVMQAEELSDKLKELGHDVYFISTRNKYSGHSIKRLVKNCLKTLKSPKSVVLAISKYISYDRYIKTHFNSISYDDISQLDGVIVGSDTVWDVTSEYFKESKEVFWMPACESVPVITYAASAANSTYDQLDSLTYTKAAINSYSAISVRDKYTFDYVLNHTDKSPVLVCDPTLLHGKAHYVEKCRKVTSEKYLLLYLFDEPKDEVAAQIKAVAREKGLKIVALICLGKRISFADEWVESTIDNFLSYFNQADSVVTNTFHGTVFSVIFNKQFVTLDYNKVKINEFLNQTGLEDYLVKYVTSEKINKKIDYVEVNTKLMNLSLAAEAFLKEYTGGNRFGK